MDFNDPVTIFLAVILAGVVLVGLVYIGREIAGWYYKIDIRLNEQRKTNEMLEALLKHYEIKVPKLDENTITVRIKESGKVINVGLNAWEKMKKEYGEDSYEIVK